MQKTYRDSSGTVWAKVDRDTYRLIRGDGPDTKRGWEFSYSDHLAEVNPYCDESTSKAIRAELAIVFDAMAEEVWSAYSYSGVTDDIRSELRSILEEKSRILRQSLDMEE